LPQKCAKDLTTDYTDSTDFYCPLNAIFPLTNRPLSPYYQPVLFDLGAKGKEEREGYERGKTSIGSNPFT
jgi:hypothetical protein